MTFGFVGRLRNLSGVTPRVELKGKTMRTIVVVILLLASLALVQAQSNPENGIVEFYTTPSTRPQPLVIYSGDQRLGEVTLNQVVRFSGAPGTYSFGLRPDALPSERITLALKSGQHLYLRVNAEGFFLGNADEAVPPVPAARAASASSKSDDLASKENATVYFYRDRQGPNQQVTIYSLFVAGSRPIASLQKGEYIAISVKPGMTAFSWTPAPARGQTVMMDVGRGQQIFLKVQPTGITPIPDDAARSSFQDLQTVDITRIFDTARVVDQGAKPVQAVAESTGNPARPNVQSEPPKPPNRRPLADGEPPQTVRAATNQQKPTEPRQEIKIRGYVTAVTSPSTFEIDLYRVIRNGNVAMQFENPGRDVQFNIDNVKVGTELDIQGEYDETTRELLAKTIKVDLDQFRSDI